MPSGMTENTKKHIAYILEILRRDSPSHIRRISRVLSQAMGRQVNPNTVNRIVDKYLADFVEIEETNRYGNTIKLVSLKREKEATKVDDVLKYLQLKSKIRSPK